VDRREIFACITGNIIKDAEAKLNDTEIKFMCMTLASAGIDTAPG
jgi:phenylacetate 2-hydroxylase